MRILHTSDWHLGISTGFAALSRRDEQRQFLDWLLLLLQERKLDTLVVAGDIFDSMHPSSDALELYYRFLARIPATGLRQVVIVGGNHDSAAQLNAPRALLQAVDVQVLGGLPPKDEGRDGMLAPLKARGSEEVQAVCLAVPYVHEYKLGIRTTDLDVKTTRADFRAAFSKLYTELADRAEELYPGRPILATGHLTLGGEAKRGDYPQEIHQVGNIEGLPPDILDPRIRYAALGHIHRCYPIKGSTAWYSGSPISYSLNEGAANRRVLLVEIPDQGPAKVEPITVPQSRELLQLKGSPEQVLSAFIALSWSTALPPLVHALVETNQAEPGFEKQLRESVGERPEERRPILVQLKQQRPKEEEPLEAPEPLSLDSLDPGQVFGLLCDAQKLEGQDRDRLEGAFASIASADPESFDEMLNDVGTEPA